MKRIKRDMLITIFRTTLDVPRIYNTNTQVQWRSASRIARKPPVESPRHAQRQG
ncbi:MAG: hypothetical protein GYB31_00575 [Bacteroidetes bacterium]|nr:hypothetical protein [Bacteroidota bacterium]